MAAITGEKSELYIDLVEENEYLLQLVNYIPTKIYFDQDVQKRIKSEKHLTMDRKAESLKRSLWDRTELSARNKHKRARLDPLFNKSVSQIHEELSNKKEKRKKKQKGSLRPLSSSTRAANIEELQKRLQEKISELQAKRKCCQNNDPLKKKLKTKEKKLKHKKAILPQVNEVEMQTKTLSKKNPNQSEEKPKFKKEGKSEEKPKFNKEGKIIYGKLDFSADGSEEKKKSEFSGKKYKKLLKKVEQKNEKIEKLKQEDAGKAAIVEEKEKWKKAILKAENVKVKDDPKLLMKSMKKEEKIKKKKAKAWKERTEHTEAMKKARQEKRTKNIQKRKKDKLEHKIKRAKKKGRVIPGF
ncbi:surfeit locus protein 6-like protein [Nephila pilipes]|uniref:Surfeit locus protein 6-like protein n=1 Tax=Nephila pilipes TaxID=299642 RepID=A0A8X6UL28_NEPPI|nr:surfeit locus protein 6-like protein [Nephila pilipes]